MLATTETDGDKVFVRYQSVRSYFVPRRALAM